MQPRGRHRCVESSYVPYLWGFLHLLCRTLVPCIGTCELMAAPVHFFGGTIRLVVLLAFSVLSRGSTRDASSRVCSAQGVLDSSASKRPTCGRLEDVIICMALFLFSVVVALHHVRIYPGWRGELYTVTTVLCPQAQYSFFSFPTTSHIIGALVQNTRAVAIPWRKIK
jgi:hypothetical protein